MKKFFSDFKKFISRGNIMDLAIAVVIGGAFSKIVTSMVNDIIMPLIGLATGGASVKELKWVIKKAVIENGVVISPENALSYGNFIQVILDFLIIAFFIFVVFRVVNASTKKLEKLKEEILSKIKKDDEDEVSEEVKEEVKKVLTDAQKQEVLLTEIRDLLKIKTQSKEENEK